MAGTGWLSNMSFSTKTFLGFAVVVLLSVASMGMAYVGYQKIRNNFASYKMSVTEADAVRTVERELTAYQLLARYYARGGAEADATATLDTEKAASVAIDKARAAIANPDRMAPIATLTERFRAFSSTFNEILVLKRQNATLAQQAVQNGGGMLRSKIEEFEDSASFADQTDLRDKAREAGNQLVTANALARMFTTQFDMFSANGADSRLQMISNLLGTINLGGNVATSARIEALRKMVADYQGRVLDHRFQFAEDREARRESDEHRRRDDDRSPNRQERLDRGSDQDPGAGDDAGQRNSDAS